MLHITLTFDNAACQKRASSKQGHNLNVMPDDREFMWLQRNVIDCGLKLATQV